MAQLGIVDPSVCARSLEFIQHSKTLHVESLNSNNFASLAVHAVQSPHFLLFFNPIPKDDTKACLLAFVPKFSVSDWFQVTNWGLLAKANNLISSYFNSAETKKCLVLSPPPCPGFVSFRLTFSKCS